MSLCIPDVYTSCRNGPIRTWSDMCVSKTIYMALRTRNGLSTGLYYRNPYSPIM